MALKSMKIDKQDQEQKMQQAMSEASEYQGPEYPYGLRIHLDNDSLEKLGITELPEVGQKKHMAAKVECVEVSLYERSDGTKEKRMELQITDMGLEAADKDMAKRLYGGGE